MYMCAYVVRSHKGYNTKFGAGNCPHNKFCFLNIAVSERCSAHPFKWFRALLWAHKKKAEKL